VLAGVLLGDLLEEVELVLHGGDDEVVLALLVVLRLLLGGVARALRGLRPLVDLLVVVLGPPHFLLFDQLAALEIPRGHHWFPPTAVLTANDWQLKVIRLVHFCVFGTFSDGRCGQSLLISTLIMKGKKECWKGSTSRR
jgi:hypothetical protein